MKSYVLILTTLIGCLSAINPVCAMSEEASKKQIARKALIENDFLTEIQTFAEDRIAEICSFVEESLIPFKKQKQETIQQIIQIEAQLNQAYCNDSDLVESLVDEAQSLKNEVLLIEKSQSEFTILFNQITNELYMAVYDFHKVPLLAYGDPENNKQAKSAFEHYLNLILEFEIDKAQGEEIGNLEQVLRDYIHKLNEFIHQLGENSLYALILHAKVINISKQLLAVSIREVDSAE